MLGNRSVTEDVLSTLIYILELMLNESPLTPLSSNVNGLEALILYVFLLGNKNACLPFFTRHRRISPSKNSSSKLKPTQILYGIYFVKNNCQL